MLLTVFIGSFSSNSIPSASDAIDARNSVGEIGSFLPGGGTLLTNVNFGFYTVSCGFVFSLSELLASPDPSSKLSNSFFISYFSGVSMLILISYTVDWAMSARTISKL